MRPKPVIKKNERNDDEIVIVVAGIITVEGTTANNQVNKILTSKNNAPCRSCVSTISNTLIDSEEGFYIVIPMCNLLKYSNNYSMTLGSLWNYYGDDVNGDVNENNYTVNYRINSSNITANKSFEFKTKITRKTSAVFDRLDKEVLVPLKYLTNFWRPVNFSFIKCEVEFDLSKKF